MKTAISIPDALFDAAEQLAERLGMTRSGLYSAAIEEYLATHRVTEVRERLDAVYGEEDSEMDAGWVEAQADALPREDW
jgi:metal-responsive CopG/Arc/MetJ family transcriptional regulator